MSVCIVRYSSVHTWQRWHGKTVHDNSLADFILHSTYSASWKVICESIVAMQYIYIFPVSSYINISWAFRTHVRVSSKRRTKMNEKFTITNSSKENVRKTVCNMEQANNQNVLSWKINWAVLGFATYHHIAGMIGVWYISALKWQTLLLVSQTLFWSEIGITGGSHRLWSHRSYKAHWTLRTFLMFCTSLSNQGTIYHWTRDHRVHHKFSETEADPHNVSNEYIRQAQTRQRTIIYQ